MDFGSPPGVYRQTQTDMKYIFHKMTSSLTDPCSGAIRAHTFRLQPDDSLKDSLNKFAHVIFSREREKQSASLFMMTAVGSLKDVTLRLANASNFPSRDAHDRSSNDIKRWSNERFEIVSLVGTFSPSGDCHLHISISDAQGKTFGGHLVEGKVFTTCEVVLGSVSNVLFHREYDEMTGYKELLPKKISKNQVLPGFCIMVVPFLVGLATSLLFLIGYIGNY